MEVECGSISKSVEVRDSGVGVISSFILVRCKCVFACGRMKLVNRIMEFVFFFRGECRIMKGFY